MISSHNSSPLTETLKPKPIDFNTIIENVIPLIIDSTKCNIQLNQISYSWILAIHDYLWNILTTYRKTSYNIIIIIKQNHCNLFPLVSFNNNSKKGVF